MSANITEIEALRRELAQARAENVRLIAVPKAGPSILDFINALTPSNETKRYLIGEFRFEITVTDEDGDEVQQGVEVPWPTIKDVMAAIFAYAMNRPLDTGAMTAAGAAEAVNDEQRWAAIASGALLAVQRADARNAVLEARLAGIREIVR